MRSAISRTIVALSTLIPWGVVGCTGADNPKMPDVAPSTAKPDTEVPKATGAGGQQYGASKKYQDMMNR